jgi:hypothetical protein
VLLAPEERDLLRDSAAAAGLPPHLARRVVPLVEAGVLPLDPLALTQRIKGLGELLQRLGAAGSSASGSGSGGSDAAVRLLSSPEGLSLLSVTPARLQRQVAWLAQRLPAYRPEWLLAALPRWSVHGPGHVAKRLGDVEQLFRQHLGVEFPREALGGARQQWRWLMTLSHRTQTVSALELILL